MRLVKDEVRKGSYGKVRNRGWFIYTSLVGVRSWMRVLHPMDKELYYEIDITICEKVHDNVVKPLHDMLQ